MFADEWAESAILEMFGDLSGAPQQNNGVVQQPGHIRQGDGNLSAASAAGLALTKVHQPRLQQQMQHAAAAGMAPGAGAGGLGVAPGGMMPAGAFDQRGVVDAGLFGASNPYGQPFGMGGVPTEQHGVSQVELELELQLRGNLLVQQQRRIVQLENELQKTWQQMEYMRLQLQAHERQQKNKPPEKKAQSRYWTPEEHARFLEALEKFGPKEVRAISEYVGTRTTTQVRTHAQKFYLKLQKEERLAAERKAKALATGQSLEAVEAAEARGAKRRRTRSSRMQMPADLSKVPRREGMPPPVTAAQTLAAAADRVRAASNASAAPSSPGSAAATSTSTTAQASAAAPAVAAPQVSPSTAPTAASSGRSDGAQPASANSFKVSMDGSGTLSRGPATPVRPDGHQVSN